MTSAGLNSLQQKGYQISVKNWIFYDPLHKKGLVLVIWVLGMIKSSESVDFLMKWGCWGHWGHWGCWGHWGHWGCRGFKAWKITTEDFKVIALFGRYYITKRTRRNCSKSSNICSQLHHYRSFLMSWHHFKPFYADKKWKIRAFAKICKKSKYLPYEYVDSILLITKKPGQI